MKIQLMSSLCSKLVYSKCGERHFKLTNKLLGQVTYLHFINILSVVSTTMIIRYRVCIGDCLIQNRYTLRYNKWHSCLLFWMCQVKTTGPQTDYSDCSTFEVYSQSGRDGEQESFVRKTKPNLDSPILQPQARSLC